MRRVSAALDAARKPMRLSEIRWFVFVFGCWAILLWFVGVAQIVPASHWFRVDRVEMRDAPAMTPPPMIVERQILRPFRATWVVSVMREGAAGFYTFCTARGENDYLPDNALPDAMTLDWWTWPHQCHLPPGRYTVNTVWSLHPAGYPTKEVRIRSNAFTMH